MLIVLSLKHVQPHLVNLLISLRTAGFMLDHEEQVSSKIVETIFHD